MRLLQGNCLRILPTLESCSIDAVVTDPPYELGFMSLGWDNSGIAFDVRMWREVLRVMKPGSYLLAFGGTRTYHRLACAIEDAGFVLKDELASFYDTSGAFRDFVDSLSDQQKEALARALPGDSLLAWLYGSGFPKSLDISKALDKAANAEREVIGERDRYRDGSKRAKSMPRGNMLGNNANGVADITTPATDLAQQWDGWGTALKPAYEPIILAQKPLEGTYAANVTKWGVGGLNIAATRIGMDSIEQGRAGRGVESSGAVANEGGDREATVQTFALGRWPANILLDKVAAELLDAQTGTLKSGTRKPSQRPEEQREDWRIGTASNEASEGGASRFFYCAKASTKERGASIHPTVKPLELTRYLVRLITPKGGTVLDLFSGHGTTGVACVHEGMEFVGIELVGVYFFMAKSRIERAQRERAKLSATHTA